MYKYVTKNVTRNEYCNVDVPDYVSCYSVTSSIGGTRCGKGSDSSRQEWSKM